jgi:hypothetical protein
MRWELIAGLIISTACLAGALGQLFWFMWQAKDTLVKLQDLLDKLMEGLPKADKPTFPEAKILRFSVAATISLMRVSLLSSGIMVGVAFGFLGFALFVMGITDAANLNLGVQASQLVLEHAAPGLIVLVVAAVLIAVCVTQRIEVPLEPDNKAPPP